VHAVDLEVSLGERERHRHLINAIFLITRDKNWSCPREPFRRSVHLVFLRSLGGHLGDSKGRAKAVKYMYTA